MTTSEKKQLMAAACKVRMGAIKGVHAAKAGHPGGSLSAADLFTYLYFKELRIDPKNPKWEDRDRFVLSKGHTAPGLYAALALRGYFPEEDLLTLRQIGSHLQGHPNMNLTPGVDMSTGSLGQGISCAVGMAMAGKYRNKDYRVYTILGDGELAEGQVWEAVLAANKYHLDNLCACVDVNGLQIDGRTCDVMPTEPLDKKFEAFGWHVIQIDGHDYEQIAKAYDEAKTVKGQPTVILAKTVKGKGVSFMEGDYNWHGKAPSAEQFQQAKAELEARLHELEG